MNDFLNFNDDIFEFIDNPTVFTICENCGREIQINIEETDDSESVAKKLNKQLKDHMKQCQHT